MARHPTTIFLAARAGVFVTPHGPVETPAFMAVGTLALAIAVLTFLRRVGIETPGGTRDGIDAAESEDVAAV